MYRNMLDSTAGHGAKGAFLMAGGGTGGHVIPALAVARELRQRGREIFFVGTERGLESRLAPKEGFSSGAYPDRRTQARRPAANRRYAVAASDQHGAGGAAARYESRRRRLQHGRLCRRTSGDRRTAPPRAGGHHGAQRRARLDQPPYRAVRRARADQFPGDGSLLSRAAARKSPACRCARSSSLCPPRGSVTFHSLDYRRQPRLAHAEPGRAPELAAVSGIRPAAAHHPPDRTGHLRRTARGVCRIRPRRRSRCHSSPTCRPPSRRRT